MYLLISTWKRIILCYALDSSHAKLQRRRPSATLVRQVRHIPKQHLWNCLSEWTEANLQCLHSVTDLVHNFIQRFLKIPSTWVHILGQWYEDTENNSSAHYRVSKSLGATIYHTSWTYSLMPNLLVNNHFESAFESLTSMESLAKAVWSCRKATALSLDQPSACIPVSTTRRLARSSSKE